ncbi:MAG: AraC family transcriptional regulator, partial [Muribaculaceae bacterium]|nr:AraC family transcriptional regulator [Muribaculaceae bacterium]
FLLLDNKPIKSIADLLGFSDLPYFIKIFKKHTGQTPLEFRTSRLSERYL